MEYAYATLILLCALGSSPSDASLQVSPETLLPHNLVEASVTSVTRATGGYRARLEVTHVYKGDHELLGKPFATTLSEAFRSHGTPLFVPPLKVGDTVIWLLRRQGDRLEHVAKGIRMKGTGNWLPILLPAREGEEDAGFPYSDVLAFAKAVEKTANAPPHRRYGLLEELAVSETRTVATWAMYALVEADPERAADFLRQLLRRPEVSVLQKILADQVLAALDETGWKVSQDRLALYRKCVSAPVPENAAESLVGSLNLMLQHPPFPAEAVLQLVQTAIANENLPPEFRARAIRTLADARRYPQQREQVFEFLLELLEKTALPDLEIAAASVLRHALNEEVRQHRGEVLRALPSVENETATMLLREALAIKPRDVGAECR